MISQTDIIEVLKEVKDYEAGVDIVALGLIYAINVSDAAINIDMSLTSPFCPYADFLINEAEQKLKEKYSKNVSINLTFTPEWTPWMIDEETRFKLDIDLSEVPNG